MMESLWSSDYEELYLACLPGWADMYVDGTWTLERFEAHADAMRESLFAPLWSDAELHALLVCGICLEDHGDCCCGDGRFRTPAPGGFFLGRERHSSAF